MNLNNLNKKELIALNQETENKLNHTLNELNELENELKRYKELIQQFNHQKYGKKSEKLTSEVLISLFDEVEVEATTEVIEPTYEEITYKRKKTKGKKEKDLSLLSTVEIHHDLESCTCEKCSGNLRKVSENIRSEIVYTPAKYEHHKHIQPVYICDHCDKQDDQSSFYKKEMPTPLITKSVASASLVASIIHDKFEMSLPLYRQEKRFMRNDVMLTRATMSNWLNSVYDNYLKELEKVMIKKLLDSEYLLADETTVQVLKEKGIAVSTKSYMWVYKTGRSEDSQMVLFRYEANRSHQHVKNHLEGYTGKLQTDGYQAYDDLQGIIHYGCLAHARRKFSDVKDSLPKGTDIKGSVTADVLKAVASLSKIEKDLYKKDDDEIRATRQEKSLPIFNDMMEKIKNAAQGRIYSDKLKTALNYMINQEEKIRRIFDDPCIELTTNSIERAIRPFTIGRNNWIFCNTPKGANVSAFYYSLIESAKANKLDPYKYLEYLFLKLPESYLNDESLNKLAPYSKDLPKELYIQQTTKR